MASETAKRAAEEAVKCIGFGYDLTEDLRLKYCKWNSSRLILLEDARDRTMDIPSAGVSVPNVPKSIKCDKGDRTRLNSDILPFQQMSEQFNQDLSLAGKIPTGHFNAAFEFSGVWQKDAAITKALAFDGVFITLYNIALEKSQVVLCDHIKQAVPSAWDPAELAKFIEKYGTHVIVGVRMGGKDIVFMKQSHPSAVEASDAQKRLKDMADKIFTDGTGQHNKNSDKHERAQLAKEKGLAVLGSFPPGSYSHTELQDMKFMCRRKGGSEKSLSHKEWCQTVQFEPDIVSMSFVPIISLLSGIHGSGYLTHAINLYLRYKPPIEELHQFLEFQLPRHWAPVFGELAVGPDKRPSSASLQFSLMGPKLYVNTVPVDVGKKPVTGLRLYLEGKRNNCLAIHLQHLSSLPKTFQLEDEPNGGGITNPSDNRRYYEKVQWKSFSHICTAPVESDEDLAIVTGANFEVGDSGLKKVLFLRLYFSKVIGPTNLRRSDWDGSPALAQKSGIISTLISGRFSTTQKQAPQLADVNINSALYPDGPPAPAQAPKLLRFVDTTEMTRGPQDSPGYWVVSGAKLHVEKSKISLRVKYSLLTVVSSDEDASLEY